MKDYSSKSLSYKCKFKSFTSLPFFISNFSKQKKKVVQKRKFAEIRKARRGAKKLFVCHENWRSDAINSYVKRLAFGHKARVPPSRALIPKYTRPMISDISHGPRDFIGFIEVSYRNCRPLSWSAALEKGREKKKVRASLSLAIASSCLGSLWSLLPPCLDAPVWFARDKDGQMPAEGGSALLRCPADALWGCWPSTWRRSFTDLPEKLVYLRESCAPIRVSLFACRTAEYVWLAYMDIYGAFWSN